MRAKEVNFERGKDPKDAMGIGVGTPDLNDITDYLVEPEVWDPMESYVNESLIDGIYRKFPNAKPADVVKAITIVIEEQLDNWYQMYA
jgi:hypothetical protein